MTPHVSALTVKKMMIGLVVILWVFQIPAFAADRFTNNGDGTVTDNQKGLMWPMRF